MKVTHDSARGHVTGTAEYVDDRPILPNEVFVDVYYSPVAYAKIKSIDTSQAFKIAGAVAVYSYKDLQHNIWGNIFHDQPFLAENVVQYAGEAILIVVAERREALLPMRKAIKAEFEELEPTLSIAEARSKKLFIGPLRTIARGDYDTALKSAPHKISGVIKMAGQDHFYLESQACIAYPKEDGQLELHSSSQHPSEVQQMVSEALKMRLSDIVCVVKRMGGAFGGKESQAGPFAVYAALVAQKLKRPARLILTKDDDMQITGKRNPFENEYEVGFDNEGKLLAVKINLYSDGGAYADLSTAIMERAMLHSDNAYLIENMIVTGQVCKTNTAPNTAFRGFGGPKGMISIENIIEEVAQKLKIDALKVRELNCYQQNDKTHYEQTIEDNILPELFAKIKSSSDYVSRRIEIDHFNKNSKSSLRGLSCTAIKFGISFTTRFLNQANALVNVFPDGSVQVSTGATEMGQGVNIRIAQVVSEAFGIPVASVRMMPTSTEKNSNTSATAASSGADLNGRAAIVACEKIKGRLGQVAKAVFARSENLRGRKVAGSGTAPEIIIDESLSSDMIFENGLIKDPSSGKQISFKDLLEEAYLNRISLSGYGFYRYPGIHFNKETGKGNPFFYYTNGVAVSEVNVDRYTGEIKVLRTDILMDLGRTMNYDIDMGQITGAFVQGMGWLTTEKLFFNNKGQLKTYSPSTYKIPSVQDIPRIFNVELIENDLNSKNLKGNKAVGEPPLMLAISVWTAVKNALSYSGKTAGLAVPASQESVLMELQA